MEHTLRRIQAQDRILLIQIADKKNPFIPDGRILQDAMSDMTPVRTDVAGWIQTGNLFQNRHIIEGFLSARPVQQNDFFENSMGFIHPDHIPHHFRDKQKGKYNHIRKYNPPVAVNQKKLHFRKIRRMHPLNPSHIYLVMPFQNSRSNGLIGRILFQQKISHTTSPISCAISVVFPI